MCSRIELKEKDVTDVSLISQSKKSYRGVNLIIFNRIMCFNDKMQPQDPSYFCEKCYVNLHQE